jgi:16S rRNA (guanine527-N7)-methyltransferase
MSPPRPDPAPAADPGGALLRDGLARLGLTADRRQQRQLLDYLSLLQTWNRRINLTAVRDPRQMVGYHLLDCLAALAAVERRMPMAARRVLDVGSGAGLPGVVWAVMRPDWTVRCVDAVAKKAGFVRQVAAELGLGGLAATHGRIEALPPMPADLIVSRAFASLADFVTLTHAHLAPGGFWLALKGRLPDEEMAVLPATIDVFHVEPLTVPGLDAQRCLVWMRPATA